MKLHYAAVSDVKTALTPHAADNPTAGMMHAEPIPDSENNKTLCSCCLVAHHSFSADKTQKSIAATVFDQ